MGASPFQDDHLVWLESACYGTELVGGKGASLGRLVSLGAPVPPALSLTTRAYRAFATTLGLPSRPDNLAEDDLARTRSLIEQSVLGPTVADLLGRAFAVIAERLGVDAELAVRSSAIDEDSAAFSFAGLHDTVLGVRGPAAFELAVRRCWASLWTERAMAYRAGVGRETGIAIAVVAQQMVRCDISFVAFTADPISGRDDRLLIDATWGLGEAIVSGVVNPDHVVIDPDGEIADYRIGDKQLMIIADDAAATGIRAVPVPRAMSRMPALSANQARQVAAQCRSLADRLGHPADFEGGFAGDALFIFQARPITTLAARASPAMSYG